MIFGNPDRFAIYMDVVNDWCNGSYIEGISALYMGEKYICGELRTCGLYSDVDDITTGILSNPPLVTQDFFEESAVTLVKKLLKKRHPALVFNSLAEYTAYPDYLYEDNEMTYDATFETLSKYPYKIFVFRYENLTRILCTQFNFKDSNYFNLGDVEMEGVIDLTMETEELQNIILTLKKWYENLITRKAE